MVNMQSLITYMPVKGIVKKTVETWRIVKMKRINIFRKIIDKFWEFKNQILYEIEWDSKKEYTVNKNN